MHSLLIATKQPIARKPACVPPAPLLQYTLNLTP